MNWISESDLTNAIDNLLESSERMQGDAEKTLLRNVVDPFSALVLAASRNIDRTEKVIDTLSLSGAARNISNAVGKFHQTILGSIDGWRDHDAGYDLENERKKIVAEIKNKHNTMNATSRQKTIEDLDTAIKQKGRGWIGYLALIIPKTASRYEKDVSLNNSRKVFETDGASFYTLATGSRSALNDLYEYLIDHVKTQQGINSEIVGFCKELFHTAYK